MNRNLWGAIAATVAVAAAITLGFLSSGSPARERQRHQDARSVQALYTLADELHSNWFVAGKRLPPDLGSYASTAKDPTTNVPFVYHRETDSQYQLCATFIADNRSTPPQNGDAFWLHSKGSYCFQFDASANVPRPPDFYPY